MARRDQDARPPIEVLGSDLGITSTQAVTLGPRRPKPGRWRALALVAAVVAVLGGGLWLGGGEGDAGGAGEEERDNQDRTDLDKALTSTTAEPTTTTRPTTTTTTAPTGPPLGAPVEGVLLTFSAGRWIEFDLTTGARREVDLPGNAPFEGVPVTNGIVLPTGMGVAVYHQVLGVEGEPTQRELGPADQVFRAGEDQVWLIDGRGQPGDLEGPAMLDARLVDLEGRVLRSFSVAGRWAAGATSDAVLMSRGGRIYAADERGMHAVATGYLTGVVGDDPVVVSCDELGACGLWQTPLDGGRRRLLHDVSDPDTTYFDWTTSREGQLAITQHDEASEGTGTALLLYDGSGGALGSIDASAETFAGRPSWLPGNLGLVVPSGSRLLWVHFTSSGAALDPLPLDRAGTEGAFVITP